MINYEFHIIGLIYNILCLEFKFKYNLFKYKIYNNKIYGHYYGEKFKGM